MGTHNDINEARLVVLGGKEYQLGGITQGVKEDFETWLEGRTRDAILRDFGKVSERALNLQLNAFNVARGLGEFSWGSAAYSQAIGTTAGIGRLLYLLMRERSLELKPEDALNLWKDNADKLQPVLREVLEGNVDGPPSSDPANP